MDEPEVMTEPEPMPEPESGTPSPERRRGRGWIVWLLLLIILGVAAWYGWQWWHARDGGQAASRQQAALDQQHVRQLDALQQQVAALGTELDDLRSSNDALRQRLGDGDAVEHLLREQVLGMAERVSHLEDAVASMARQRLSGRDSMLVNEAEMLLQLGQQRYELFGDAEAAIEAFALADRSLAAVGTPRFVSVRQSLAAEREALVASKPISRSSTLAALQRLRGQWQALPLKPPDQSAVTASADEDTWQRVWGSLSSLVQVRRESADAPATMIDTALARQLGALSLAQAQAALLASDIESYRLALERAAGLLDKAFDIDARAVQQVRAELQRLQSAVSTNATVPHLGAALQELRNLRAVEAMTRHGAGAMGNPDSPAPAATAAQPAPTAPVPAPAAAGSAT